MPSYSKLLNEYLTHDELKSLNSDYQSNQKKTNSGDFDKKNKIISEFFQTQVLEITQKYFKIDFQKLYLLGSGTQGVVFGFDSNPHILKYAFSDLSKISTRHKGPFHLDNLPNEIAFKFQLLDDTTSYWEKRMLREEYIMNYLYETTSKSQNSNTPLSIIRESIPKLYFGCTIKFKDVKFRLTFMELISERNYMTIEKLLKTNFPITEQIYENIENIVKSLWKLKVSHNDLSIKNIMIGYLQENKNQVKLIDFGLSQQLNKEINILSKEDYELLFSKQLDEQHGSNVAKLKDLCKIFKRKDCT
jgi:serine/threonine protein kinase